jgi:excisionase family DNA binding protein
MRQQAFTIQEMMKAYRTGRTKLYDEIAAGRLKTYKVGRATRVSAHAAEEWQRNAEAATAQLVAWRDAQAGKVAA